MVTPTRMAVNLFDMTRRAARGEMPKWAQSLHDKMDALQRKVNLLMALDATLSAKLTAIVAGLIPEVQALIDSNQAKDAKIDSLQGQVDSDAAADAQAAQQEQVDTQGLQDALSSLKTLVDGPDTPDVTPVPPADVPGVVTGDTPVTDSSGNPVSDDGGNTTD